MESGLQLTYDTDLDGCLTIHHANANRLGITQPSEKIIHFGIQSFPAKVLPAPNIPLDEASLSADLRDKLGLPRNCRYELKQIGKDIYIGPFIGLLAGYYKQSVKRKLVDLLDYVSHYREIKGAIIVFCIENIDQVNHTVNGYLYNPVTHGWDEGVFPYPSAILVATKSVSQKWIHHFEYVIGHSVLNHFQFNKWSVFKCLSGSIDIKSYLPHTILYQSPVQLFSFLKKHPYVQVKSISLGKAEKHYRISRDEFFIVITDLKKGKETRINCVNRNQVHEWFSNHLKEGEYIIVQSLDSNQISSVDIRFVLVKDIHGKWKQMGMFGRKGKFDDFKQPLTLIQKDSLTEILKLNDLISSLLIQEAKSIAHDAVQVIESNDHHLAIAVVDLTIDERGGIWLNDIYPTNPTPDIALVAGNPELYYNTFKSILIYTKKLAGFS